MLLRFFSHTEEAEPSSSDFAGNAEDHDEGDSAAGEALTKMPVGDPTYAGMTAGRGLVTTAMSRSSAQEIGVDILRRALRELAIIAVRLRSQAGIPKEIDESAAALEALAQEFAPAGRAWSGAAEIAEFQALEAVRIPMIEPELNGPYLSRM
jgi:hypothetical protein